MKMNARMISNKEHVQRIYAVIDVEHLHHVLASTHTYWTASLQLIKSSLEPQH